jgi:hypothetical protein
LTLEWQAQSLSQVPPFWYNTFSRDGRGAYD